MSQILRSAPKNRPMNPLAVLRRAYLQLKFRRHLFLPGLLLSSALFVFAHFVVSCASPSGTVLALPPSAVPGATFVGNESCATCHDDITKTFHGNIHSRVHLGKTEAGKSTSCESCHGPGSKHVAAGGGTTFNRLIVNPGTVADACFRCHVDRHAEFRLPSHHPVLEGKMNCVDCHDPHGHDVMKPSGGRGGLARLNESCAACHREQSRHFVYEHEAMREGCTACHNPHGSVNQKLLIQRDSNLCLKCHAQNPGPAGKVIIGKINHSPFLRQGSCATAGCHSAVHGSNIHPKLLH